jgi:hypothetical protein
LLIGLIKQDLTLCCLQETHTTGKEIYSLKVNGCQMILQANRNQAGVAIHISNKADSKPKLVRRDK